MKLNVGLIGLGRLGRVYAHDLASRVAGVRLAALADTNAKLAEETARDLEVPRWYPDPLAMLDDPGVDAAIIVSPTDTHTALAVAICPPGSRANRCSRCLLLLSGYSATTATRSMLFRPSVTTSNDLAAAAGMENGTRTHGIVAGIAPERMLRFARECT